MYTKAKIYNLALGALLLQRQITDPDTDTSNEAKVLNTHYDTALRTTLEDLDLDSTSTIATLALVEEDPVDGWDYAYTYPADCAFLRRLKPAADGARVDSRYTHIAKRVAIHDGDKVIFSNEASALIEYISHTIALTTLSAPVGLCIAYRLAFLSSPLIVGKGASTLKKELLEKYTLFKSEAQEQDRRENMNYVDEWVDSEFVAERLS